ncbi:hypothetical protein B0J12DRAFT_639125 [Macrophomina phaseolina]|uniref:Uncharacterized protein n=1 Tax=Macrophomina phaseolina TaxID=35725 RepID=A0ABQ8GY23_9PEZI|nr:hypothetical protein B0J12DRAFT_639125 [Macrophomina phaseolina]
MGQHGIVSMVTDRLSCTDTNSLLRVNKYMMTHVSTSIDPPWWRDYFTNLDWIADLGESIITVLAIYITTGTSVDPSMNPDPNKDGTTSIFITPISTRRTIGTRDDGTSLSVGRSTEGFMDVMMESVMYGVKVVSPGMVVIVPPGMSSSVRMIKVGRSVRPESGEMGWMLNLGKSMDELVTSNTIRVADMKTNPCEFTTWLLGEAMTTFPIGTVPVILSVYISSRTNEIESIHRVT